MVKNAAISPDEWDLVSTFSWRSGVALMYVRSSNSLVSKTDLTEELVWIWIFEGRNSSASGIASQYRRKCNMSPQSMQFNFSSELLILLEIMHWSLWIPYYRKIYFTICSGVLKEILKSTREDNDQWSVCSGFQRGITKVWPVGSIWKWIGFFLCCNWSIKAQNIAFFMITLYHLYL